MTNLYNISLPIQTTLPILSEHLDHHSNVILVAPPGTGKTTLVPLSLINATWRQDKKIIMLEPRRIATRAAARQMSQLYNEEIGQTIGFRTRIEKNTSKNTIIEVVTQGLFLRYLLNNPLLDNIAGVIFDEVHERSIDTDLCLGLCRNLQENLRPDLRLIAMSATPSLINLKKILDCKVITSENPIHPITIHHRKRDITHLKELPSAIASEITHAWHNETGNILAFLPGAGEIHKTIHLLSIPNADIYPLYGDLPSEEQDKALQPVAINPKRRIVLATSIAETSLTVPGVRIVIDGGFRRMPQLNTDTGLTHLKTQRISKAAAQQRAGRAGREEAGIVYKLWTEATERSLAPHDKPEILEAELSEFVLICQTWAEIMGITGSDIPIPDNPLSGVIEAAKELLILIGALSSQGKLTQFGTKIAQFGAHPRLASMMLSASTMEEKALVCDIAALLEERDPLRHEEQSNVDIQSRLAWLHTQPTQQDRGLWHRIRKISQDYKKRLNVPYDQSPSTNPAPFICAAFPDRLGQRRSEIGSFRLAGGGAAHLSIQDPFAKENLLAIASVHVYKKTNICLAYPITLDMLPTHIKEHLKTDYDTALDPSSGKIIMRERLRFGRLILQDHNILATAEKAFPILLQYVKNNISTALSWNEHTKQLQARVQIAKEKLNKITMPDLSFEALAMSCDEWLSPWITGMSTTEEVQKLNPLTIMETMIGYHHLQELNHLLPSSFLLNKHKVTIDYTQATPTISAKAQYFYGVTENPTIAHGQINIQCCLLSPANRPQAITGDLKQFWNNGWQDMKKDMKGRYPKHQWPDNPAITPYQPRHKT